MSKRSRVENSDRDGVSDSNCSCSELYADKPLRETNSRCQGAPKSFSARVSELGVVGYKQGPQGNSRPLKWKIQEMRSDDYQNNPRRRHAPERTAEPVMGPPDQRSPRQQATQISSAKHDEYQNESRSSQRHAMKPDGHSKSQRSSRRHTTEVCIPLYKNMDYPQECPAHECVRPVKAYRQSSAKSCRSVEMKSPLERCRFLLAKYQCKWNRYYGSKKSKPVKSRYHKTQHPENIDSYDQYRNLYRRLQCGSETEELDLVSSACRCTSSGRKSRRKSKLRGKAGIEGDGSDYGHAVTGKEFYKIGRPCAVLGSEYVCLSNDEWKLMDKTRKPRKPRQRLKGPNEGLGPGYGLEIPKKQKRPKGPNEGLGPGYGLEFPKQQGRPKGPNEGLRPGHGLKFPKKQERPKGQISSLDSKDYYAETSEKPMLLGFSSADDMGEQSDGEMIHEIDACPILGSEFICKGHLKGTCEDNCKKPEAQNGVKGGIYHGARGEEYGEPRDHFCPVLGPNFRCVEPNAFDKSQLPPVKLGTKGEPMNNMCRVGDQPCLESCPEYICVGAAAYDKKALQIGAPAALEQMPSFTTLGSDYGHAQAGEDFNEALYSASAPSSSKEGESYPGDDNVYSRRMDDQMREQNEYGVQYDKIQPTQQMPPMQAMHPMDTVPQMQPIQEMQPTQQIQELAVGYDESPCPVLGDDFICSEVDKTSMQQNIYEHFDVLDGPALQRAHDQVDILDIPYTQGPAINTCPVLGDEWSCKHINPECTYPPREVLYRQQTPSSGPCPILGSEYICSGRYFDPNDPTRRDCKCPHTDLRGPKYDIHNTDCCTIAAFPCPVLGSSYQCSGTTSAITSCQCRPSSQNGSIQSPFDTAIQTPTKFGNMVGTNAVNEADENGCPILGPDFICEGQNNCNPSRCNTFPVKSSPTGDKYQQNVDSPAHTTAEDLTPSQQRLRANYHSSSPPFVYVVPFEQPSMSTYGRIQGFVVAFEESPPIPYMKPNDFAINVKPSQVRTALSFGPRSDSVNKVVHTDEYCMKTAFREFGIQTSQSNLWTRLSSTSLAAVRKPIVFKDRSSLKTIWPQISFNSDQRSMSTGTSTLRGSGINLEYTTSVRSLGRSSSYSPSKTSAVASTRSLDTPSMKSAQTSMSKIRSCSDINSLLDSLSRQSCASYSDGTQEFATQTVDGFEGNIQAVCSVSIQTDNVGIQKSKILIFRVSEENTYDKRAPEFTLHNKENIDCEVVYGGTITKSEDEQVIERKLQKKMATKDRKVEGKGETLSGSNTERNAESPCQNSRDCCTCCQKQKMNRGTTLKSISCEIPCLPEMNKYGNTRNPCSRPSSMNKKPNGFTNFCD